MSTQNAEPTSTRYSVEPHGNGWAIYRGRDYQHHGWNLGQLSECSEETALLVEGALNAVNFKFLGDEVEWEGKRRTVFAHLYLMTGERDRYKSLYEQMQPSVDRMQRRIEEFVAGTTTTKTAPMDAVLSGLRELVAECRGLEGLGSEAVAARIERFIESMPAASGQ
jgi:hypothetical protein